MGVQRVQPMAEGGILAAILVVMVLSSLYIPVLGALTTLIWPLPIIILVVRHGIRWGVMGVVVAGVLIALLVHPLRAVVLTTAFGLVGLVIGFAYRRGYGAFRTLMTAIFASVLSKIAGIVLASLLFGVNPLQLQLDVMNDAFPASMEIYRSSGMMTEAQIEKAQEDFAASIRMIKTLFPVIVVFAGALDAYVNFVVSGHVLRRLGNTEIVRLRPFAKWRLPLWAVYLYAFSLIGMYWGPRLSSDLLYQASLNGNMLATFLGFVQGLSLLVYTADRYRVAKWMRVVLLLLFVTNGFLLQAVAFSGMIDIVFNVRRRIADGG